MKKTFWITILFASIGLAPVYGAGSSDGFENRCGWIENPTPANWELKDKDGTWIIERMGGEEVEGQENLPNFPENKQYWVKTNVGSYGYGCGCLMVKVNRKEMTVTEIKSGHALPLAKCKADKSLKPAE